MAQGDVQSLPTILFIEDNDYMRRMTRTHLEENGFSVIEATSGGAGIESARLYLPDLVLCDLRLPDMLGYEVLRHLRGDRRTVLTPFIILTSSQEHSDLRSGLELGADDFITKPVHIKDLLFAIHSQLEKYKHMFAVHKEERRQLQDAQQRLTLMVSHELRTPLVSITMAHELMQWKLGQLSVEDTQELLDSMGSGIRRLKHLTEQMALLTQLETGGLEQYSIRRTAIIRQFWAMIEEAINLAREFDYRHSEVTIRLEDGDKQTMVICHPRALTHAFAELINNAITFSPAGSVVRVSGWKEGGTMWISIMDRGPGISKHDLQQAMLPFQQLGREKSEQQGMGVGLPLAKGIIEAHGGVLEIHSLPERGTQMVVRIPTA
jgi:signal transduction histidine kinase